MSNRVAQLSAISCLLLPMFACSAGGDEGGSTFGSFGTSPTTTNTTNNDDNEEETGDGDGDPTTTTTGDGDPTTTTTGDGDGDPTTTTGDGDGDPGCTPGTVGCVCSNGLCGAGLFCDANNICTIGGGDGDGDGDPTTGGGNDPWDPDGCAAPNMPVTITDIEGSLCSAPCTDNTDCPPGPAGTTAQCALILDGAVDPNQCALVCTPGQPGCPAGSTCKDVPNQPGIGLCTYP